MGGQKLLWILLGLSLISLLVSAKSKNTYDVVEEDFEEDEDDEEDDCDPHCLKNCHELKCEAGFVRDACGCCECARSEGEYCNIRPLVKKGGKVRKEDVINPRSRLLSSFLLLTPPYTFAPTTSFTNFEYDDDDDFSSLSSSSSSSPSPSSSSVTSSASSPTLNELYASTEAVESRVTLLKDQKKKKERERERQPVKKRDMIYSSKSNSHPVGKKTSYFDHQEEEEEEEGVVYYGTCGDYLECKPFFPKRPEGARKEETGNEDELFRDANNNKKQKSQYIYKNTNTKRSSSETRRKRDESLLLERFKRGFNYGGYLDRNLPDVNEEKNSLKIIQKNYDNRKLNPLLFFRDADDEADVYETNSDDDEINDDNDSLLRFLSSSSSLPPRNNDNNNSHHQSHASAVMGTCVCRYAVTVCASDGRTYKNICQLRAASGRGEGSNPDVHVVKEGPCDPPATEGMKPIIVSGPEFVKNVTGGSAALSCEVKGDPIPFISWLMTNVNNQTFELPSDDAAMMTLNQGGPEKREITAWIQIMKLRKNHEGDYTCIAFNKHGKAKATGRLKVQKKSRKNRRHHHKKE